MFVLRSRASRAVGAGPAPRGVTPRRAAVGLRSRDNGTPRRERDSRRDALAARAPAVQRLGRGDEAVSERTSLVRPFREKKTQARRARRDRTRVVLRSFRDDADPRAFARSSEAQRKSSRVNSAFRFFRSFAHGAAVRKKCPEIENQHPADCAQLQWRWTSWLCFSRGWVRDARRKPHNTARVDFRRRRDPRRIATPLAFR